MLHPLFQWLLTVSCPESACSSPKRKNEFLLLEFIKKEHFPIFLGSLLDEDHDNAEAVRALFHSVHTESTKALHSQLKAFIDDRDKKVCSAVEYQGPVYAGNIDLVRSCIAEEVFDRSVYFVKPPQLVELFGDGS